MFFFFCGYDKLESVGGLEKLSIDKPLINAVLSSSANCKEDQRRKKKESAEEDKRALETKRIAEEKKRASKKEDQNSFRCKLKSQTRNSML